MRGLLPLGYEVDVPATLLCAIALCMLAGWAAWTSWHRERELLESAQRQWLSLMMVRREDAETAAEHLESVCDLLEALVQSWHPVAINHPLPPALVRSERLDHISPALAPWLSRRSELEHHLHALQAGLVNLQVKFGRGDPLDALAYDLSTLSDEYQQLASTLESMLNTLQDLESQREQALAQHHSRLTSEDPYAPWRHTINSALAHMETSRTLLARSLDKPLSPRPPHLDQFLGLRP